MLPMFLRSESPITRTRGREPFNPALFLSLTLNHFGDIAMHDATADLATENARKVLDFAEAAGAENIRFRLKIADDLARDVSTTLTLLLSGLGVAMSYAVTSVRAGAFDVSTAVAVIMAAWLALAAFTLLLKCVLSRKLSVPTNEPGNILQDSWLIDELRRAELFNLQERIKQVRARNRETAIWLDRVRLMMVCSFPIALATAIAASWSL
jgi:hypothetical protein